MKATGLSALLLGLGLSFFFATMPRISGQATAPPAIDNDDIGGVVTGAQGAGSRCVGDCGNARHSDTPDPDCRHR